ARSHAEVYRLNHAVRRAKGLAAQGRPHPEERMIAVHQYVTNGLHKHDFVKLSQPAGHDDESDLSFGTIVHDEDKDLRKPVGVWVPGINDAPVSLFFPDFFKSFPGGAKRFEWGKMEAKAQHEKRWNGVLKLAFGHAITDYQCQGGQWPWVGVCYRPFRIRPG